jgi:hypothetical protein
VRGPSSGANRTAALDGGRCARGNPRHDDVGREATIGKIGRSAGLRQGGRAVGVGPLNERLMIQVADLAGGFGGAGMVVPHAAEGHGNQQHGQQGHRNDKEPTGQNPNLLWFAHPLEAENYA